MDDYVKFLLGELHIAADRLEILGKPNTRIWHQRTRKVSEGIFPSDLGTWLVENDPWPYPEREKVDRTEQIKERKHAVASAAYWFRWARKAQEEGDMVNALLNMENAYNHTEGALTALRRLHGLPLSDE